MLARLLVTPDSRLRPRRVIPLAAALLALAIFGTLLVVLAPTVAGPGLVRTGWVLFAVFALKLPLIALLWWLIGRDRELPTRPPRWSPHETSEILAYIDEQARLARELPDAASRLAYLSAEAWHVADRSEGHQKVDALTVALRVDEMAGRVRGRSQAG